MSATEPHILLESHRQAVKVRFVFWASLAVGLLSVWGGWTIFQTFGLSDADGGALKPLWQRLALGGAIACLGVTAAGGMYLYISLYALRLSRIGDRVTLTTMSPFGKRDREYSIHDVGESAYYHGRVRHVLASGALGGLWVNAPWITLRVVGHRFPFIIDLQADMIDIGGLTVLAEGGVDEWPGEGG